jgi:hypothetical protein
LNSHVSSESNTFLSKDSSSSDSIFKSKESFSDLYSGKEWDWNQSFAETSKPDVTNTIKTFDASILKSQDYIPKLLESMDWDAVLSLDDVKATAEELAKNNPTTLTAIRKMEIPEAAPFSDAFKSQDWSIMPGAIDDIDFSPDMLDNALVPDLEPAENINVFKSRDWVLPEILDSHKESKPVDEPPKTDWSAFLMSQLAPIPPSTTADAEPLNKKRKRNKRKKIVPETKEYVVISDLDVLLGRGGRTNHHPGNKRYREEVENFRKIYSSLQTDKEKTEMSLALVDVIQKLGGRFLEEDKVKDNPNVSVCLEWYVVSDIVARRKVSQALREDNDPDKRKAKRARYLAKKKATL